MDLSITVHGCVKIIVSPLILICITCDQRYSCIALRDSKHMDRRTFTFSKTYFFPFSLILFPSKSFKAKII